MVDTTADSTTPADNKNPAKVLVSLEEDDEFEDFPVEGTRNFNCNDQIHTNHEKDWNDADSKAQDGPETLWEEKWDDDDADDEFSTQLRYVLCRQHNFQVH